MPSFHHSMSSFANCWHQSSAEFSLDNLNTDPSRTKGSAACCSACESVTFWAESHSVLRR
ncbi:hypothetical protein CPB83DRAFT_863061 [Crepidotus variabilis]|uniref:Uncharacterized protein n=1 Tax=Crepidotus variabilis TaxID=179855 RepID=A0A9P6E6B6_9AGAR|nr:hypothetical protein CPB83DRAFT_863061 [Crepidotus variabilis]